MTLLEVEHGRAFHQPHSTSLHQLVRSVTRLGARGCPPDRRHGPCADTGLSDRHCLQGTCYPSPRQCNESALRFGAGPRAVTVFGWHWRALRGAQRASQQQTSACFTGSATRQSATKPFVHEARPSDPEAWGSSDDTKQPPDALRRDDPLSAGQENYASRGRTRLSVLSVSQPLRLPADLQCDAPRFQRMLAGPSPQPVCVTESDQGPRCLQGTCNPSPRHVTNP